MSYIKIDTFVIPINNIAGVTNCTKYVKKREPHVEHIRFHLKYGLETTVEDGKPWTRMFIDISMTTEKYNEIIKLMFGDAYTSLS